MQEREKIYIGIFGRRNYGKSSFINAITGQDIAIVSDVAGTTTDPVKKSIEIHGFGPVVMIDTAGIDDEGELGMRRIQKTLATIEKIDFAVLMVCNNTFGTQENMLVDEFREHKIPFMVVYNKTDIMPPTEEFLSKLKHETGKEPLLFTNIKPEVQRFVQVLLKEFPDTTTYNDTDIFGSLIQSDDLIVLVTPIDSAAPQGRMILPQVQSIRNILDHNAICVVCRETELESVLSKYNMTPKMVVTDSQAFDYVNKVVPKDVPLTSFSILLAKLKGNFEKYLEGTPEIDNLKDGDKILILESCTHHVTCEDIGTVKIPRLLQRYTGKRLSFTNVSGLDDLPEDIGHYAMVIQCGGCMITKKQIEQRLRKAIDANVPVSNYGMTLAKVNGIFDRAIDVFHTMHGDE